MAIRKPKETLNKLSLTNLSTCCSIYLSTRNRQRRNPYGRLSFGEIESIFADIIWANAPLTSRLLAELAEQRLRWKRTTTYTVLKRLCDRGLFQNQGGTVTALVSREEFYARQSEQYVQDAFQGSLPAFLAAFGSRKRLDDREIDEIQKLIDSMRR